MGVIDVLPRLVGLSLRDAAGLFAAEGAPVFPCVPGGKRPLVHHGFHDATTDPAQIGEWWRRWPQANIGIPTGSASGVEVVDVDVHSTGTGFPAFRAAHREGYTSGWAAVVRTPSGGLHAYYPAAPDKPQPSWQAAREHADFRGAGGYIIAPPSVSARPNRPKVPYRLILTSDSYSAPVDAARLRAFLDPRTAIPFTSVHAARGVQWGEDMKVLAGWVAGRGEGERNRGLFWAACRLAEAGTPPSAAVEALGPAAEHAGLGSREIVAAIRSAYRTTHAEPGHEAPPVAVDTRRVIRESSGRALS